MTSQKILNCYLNNYVKYFQYFIKKKIDDGEEKMINRRKNIVVFHLSCVIDLRIINILGEIYISKKKM